MKKSRIAIIVSVILLATFLLVACNAAGNKGSDYNSGYVQSTESSAEKVVDTDGEIMIKNATVNAETESFNDTVSKLEALIKEYKGKISGSNVTGNASYYSQSAKSRAQYILKIPAERLDDFISAAGKIMNVVTVKTTAENVSEEYYDLEAEIKTLEAKHDGLTEMLKNVDRNTDINTWIRINDELTSVDTELAKYRALMNRLEGMITYSTVTITLDEVGELTQTAEKTYGQRVKEAFKNSITAVGEFFKTGFIILISVFPFLIIAGTIVFIVIFVGRRVTKKKREKQNKDNEDKK